jgi:hypothetical protein
MLSAFFFYRRFFGTGSVTRVVELVDTQDLKSCSL